MPKVTAVTTASIAIPVALVALVAAGAVGITSAAAQSASPSPTTATTAPSPSASASEPTPTTSPTSSPSGQPFDNIDVAVAEGSARPKVPGMRPEVPLQIGQFGPRVQRIHEQLAWLGHDVATWERNQGVFGSATRNAVRAFQVKHWIPATGKVDKRTRNTLNRMSAPIGVLPRTCTSEPMALCIDKTAKVLRLVRKGKVVATMDARFGAPGMETGEGIFQIHEKSQDHISSQYHTWMPYAMFFNGDEAVHYSPDFHAVGYLHGSHGCVGVRDIDKASWLFDRVPVGTRVYVYWS